MKKILFLTYYYPPDLGAGSFRSKSLIEALSEETKGETEIHLITTMPNRYHNFKQVALAEEHIGNVKITRIDLGVHENKFARQAIAYRKYYFGVKRLVKNEKYDLVFATTQRLFSGYLAMKIAKKNKCPLFLDVRDLFRENMSELIKNRFVSKTLNFCLSFIERSSWKNADHINIVSEGFMGNFRQYQKSSQFSFFTNGIDEEFIGIKRNQEIPATPVKIVYAGNIGEGQGLEKIIPEAADRLGNNYEFIVIGDGSTKGALVEQITKRKLSNVKIIDPVNRKELKEYYENAHVLFLHLNNYKAFTKVLPSKIFEYAATDLPVVAGVDGYSAEFLKKHVQHSHVFHPCDVDSFERIIRNIDLEPIERVEFVREFSRKGISTQMARSILSYVKNDIKKFKH